MIADPFAELMKAYERLIVERDASLQNTEQIATAYEDAIHPVEVMDPEEFRRGQRKVSA